MFAAVGIILLIPISQSAAQESQPSPPAPAHEQRTEDSSWESNNESEEEELRSPFDDHIETDRDACTPATRTAPINRWITESSYSFIDNRGVPSTNSFPELLVRYGLFKRVELRLGWNYELGAGGSVVSGESGEAAEGVDTARRTREPLQRGFATSCIALDRLCQPPRQVLAIWCEAIVANTFQAFRDRGAREKHELANVINAWTQFIWLNGGLFGDLISRHHWACRTGGRKENDLSSYSLSPHPSH
jgi:hypothetical protein